MNNHTKQKHKNTINIPITTLYVEMFLDQMHRHVVMI